MSPCYKMHLKFHVTFQEQFIHENVDIRLLISQLNYIGSYPYCYLNFLTHCVFTIDIWSPITETYGSHGKTFFFCILGANQIIWCLKLWYLPTLNILTTIQFYDRPWNQQVNVVIKTNKPSFFDFCNSFQDGYILHCFLFGIFNVSKHSRSFPY